MKSKLFIFLSAMTVFSLSMNVYADISFTVGSNDYVDLDFDGTGRQRYGDLGFATKSFQIPTVDFQGYTEFFDIESIAVQFDASGGNLAADGSPWQTTGGIGIASSAGSSSDRYLDPNLDELLTISVSSTSTDPQQRVQLKQLRYSNWTGTGYPSPQIEFIGATVGGRSYYSGIVSFTNFDQPTNSVTVESVSNRALGNGSQFGIQRFVLHVTSIPEPGTFAIIGLIAIGVTLRRPNRKSVLKKSNSNKVVQL